MWHAQPRLCIPRRGRLGHTEPDTHPELRPQTRDGLDLIVDDLAGEAKGGYAEAESAAGPLAGVEDGAVVSPLKEVERGRQTRRTGADDGHALARGILRSRPLSPGGRGLG